MRVVAPSGLVTFLFTDIEGSTVRWETHREAMQLALRRHDDILREAIEAHDGYVFKTIGDAFCAAFESTADAVAAALDVQRTIAAQTWDEVGGLRVRMAVHAGETDERSGDYFGPVVNRVARLLGTGHGGQVLLSSYAAELVEGRLPEGASLRVLGTLPLRDIKEPERVHQLCGADLPQEFKPLKALETPPNNLPRQLTSFVGRRRDLDAVKELVTHDALVTIVGVGGMGKTRLALQVASDLLNDTSEGAWFVDLAPISDAALVASAVLSTLGADQSAAGSPADRVTAHLRKRSLLLVLDNCEHVMEEIAAIAAAIVARCPGVTMVATSREPLNVSGERVHRLSSLDEHSAVRLFVERAKAVAPAFEETESAMSAVGRICGRLDGIALAIELAAARVRGIPVEELESKLQLRALSGGGRDRQPRQQTMRALIDWSYELLSVEDQRCFRTMAVFSGGATLDAAKAVLCACEIDEWDAIDRLTSLADKSLIVTEDERYRLLEPIREYALELLDGGGEADGVRAAHAACFASLADRSFDEFDANPTVQWLKRNERELDNYRDALKWSLVTGRDGDAGARLAAGVAPVFTRLTLLGEGIAWAERALALEHRPAVEARLRLSVAMLYNNQGRFAPSLAAAERAVELFRTLGDGRCLARSLSRVAQELALLDRFDAAISASDEAITIANALGDKSLLAGITARSASALGPDRIDVARARAEESVRLLHELGRTDDEVRSLCHWASLEGLAGEYARCAEVIERAIPIASGDAVLWVYNFASAAYWALGDRERAIPATRKLLPLAAEANHPLMLPSAMVCTAVIAIDTDPKVAARLLGYALRRQKEASYVHETHEAAMIEGLERQLRDMLSDDVMEALLLEGASWPDHHATTVALRV